MKKHFFSLITIIFLAVFNSCSQDEELKIDNYTLSNSVKEEFQSKLLKNLIYARPDEFKSKVSITDSKIITIEEVYYLQTYYNNGYVSTSLLNLDKKSDLSRKLVIDDGGVSCTSKACASGGGCVPKLFSDYCTPCTQGAKDCVRTTGI